MDLENITSFGERSLIQDLTANAKGAFAGQPADLVSSPQSATPSSATRPQTC